MCLDKRPLATHQVVALKAVVLCLKLLQLGPPELVSDSFAHLPVIEGVAHTWARKSADNDTLDDAGVGPGGAIAGGSSAHRRPPPLAMLIVRLASLVGHKLHFCREHSEYDATFRLSAHRGSIEQRTGPGGLVEGAPDGPDSLPSAASGVLLMSSSTNVTALSASAKAEKQVNVASRLLTMMGAVDLAQRLAFSGFGGCRWARQCGRGCILPLVTEAYNVFAALTRALLDVSECDDMRGVMATLRAQYEEQYVEEDGILIINML